MDLHVQFSQVRIPHLQGSDDITVLLIGVGDPLLLEGNQIG